MTITITLEEFQALALADAIRRSGFSDWRRLSMTDADAYAAQYAAEQIRRAVNNTSATIFRVER